LSGEIPGAADGVFNQGVIGDCTSPLEAVTLIMLPAAPYSPMTYNWPA